MRLSATLPLLALFAFGLLSPLFSAEEPSAYAAHKARAKAAAEAALALCQASPAPVKAAPLLWHTDYEIARKAAAASGRHLLIDLRTTPCIWCDKLEKTTLKDPAVEKFLAAGFVCVALDASKEKSKAAAAVVTKVVAKYNERQTGKADVYYPSIVRTDSAGNLLAVYTGYMEARELLQRLQPPQAAQSQLAMPPTQ